VTDVVVHPTTVRQRTRIDRELADKTPSEQVEILAEGLMPRLTPDSVAWVFALADIADRNDLDLHVVRRCAAELARVARDKGQRMPADDDWQRCGETPSPAAARRTLAYVHGHRLRLDLKFQELNLAAPKWLVAHPNDALLHSLYAYAALGRRADRAPRLLDRVAALPDYDGSCRAVCLHGLWFASHMPDQADRILALSEEMIRKDEHDPDTFYWRAYALRRDGRYDEALTSIDRAIGLLPVGRHAEHDAYEQERVLISTTRLLGDQVRELGDQLQGQSRHHHDQLAAQAAQYQDQLAAQFGHQQDRQQEQFETHRDELRVETEQHAGAARRIVSDSLLGIVEVLALFAVLVSYLVALVALAVRADQLWQSLATIGVMVLGAAGIFWAMRTVARLDRGRERGERGEPGERRDRRPQREHRERRIRIRRSPVRRLGEWLGFPEPVG
jgi:tetratricopeptide (TPR) repeat protein